MTQILRIHSIWQFGTFRMFSGLRNDDGVVGTEQEEQEKRMQERRDRIKQRVRAKEQPDLVM